jgi:hypothetical protein
MEGRWAHALVVVVDAAFFFDLAYIGLHFFVECIDVVGVYDVGQAYVAVFLHGDYGGF